MLATSRQSLTSLRDVLDARRSESDFADVAGALFAFADLLGRESGLRNTVADAGQPGEVRSALVERLLANRVPASALAVVMSTASSRWASSSDLIDATEALAAQAAFTVAQTNGTLDSVEDELFRFGRAVEASAELQMALTDPALPAQAKVDIVRRLLDGRSAKATRQIVEYVVTHLRGRRLDAAIDTMVDLAAAQRNRVVAEVRSVVALSDQQEQRLVAALSRITGRDVRVNVVIDPAVIGGASVRIGDELIDGTIASRLEQAQRALIAD